MTRQSGPKSRREHLKNLRRIRKDKDISRKPAARKAAAEPGSLFTNLGLALIIAVLVVLAGSAVLQNRLGSFDFVSSSLDPSGAGLPAIDPATIEVRVLNGCGIPGAGRRMTTRLRDLHFDVVDSDNAENFSYTHTLVIGHANSLEAAQVVARRLGCARVSSRPDNLAMVDVTVILGQDWKKFLADSGQDEEPGKWDKLLSKARSILGMD